MKLEIVLLLTISTLAKKLTQEKKKEFNQRIEARFNSNYAEALLKYMEDDESIDYTEFLSAGAFGGVWAATDGNQKKLAIKFQLDEENFPLSSKIWEKYSEIIEGQENQKVVIKMEKLPFYEDNETKKYFGVFKMERGIQADEAMVAQFNNLVEEKANSKTLFQMTKKIVNAFKLFHFGFGYYHADVKLGNIVFMEEEDQSMGVRIIDFDFTFRHPKLVCAESNRNYYYFAPNYKKCNPKYLIYLPNFRSPELTAICDGRQLRGNQQQTWEEYSWDSNFKEEAFAVGKLIEDFLYTNRRGYDKESETGKALDEIVNSLTKDRKRDRYSLTDCYELIEEKENELFGGQKEKRDIV